MNKKANQLFSYVYPNKIECRKENLGPQLGML